MGLSGEHTEKRVLLSPAAERHGHSFFVGFLKKTTDIASTWRSLTSLFSFSTTGVTAHFASLSSSSSISASLEFTFYKLLASLAGEHGKHGAMLCFYIFCYLCEREGALTFMLCFLFCFFTSGWIAALTGLNTSIPVGIIMLLIAALFTALSVGSLIMFKKVTQSQGTPTVLLCLTQLWLKCEKANSNGKNRWRM